MATSPLGGFADLSAYTPAALARARALQVNPLDALIQGAQQGLALQQLPQQLEQNALNQQLALAIKQAQVEAIPIQREQQELALRQLRAQLDPNYAAQQNEAKIAFEVDKARQLAQVQREFAQPLAAPKISAQQEGDFIVRRDPITAAEIGREPIQQGKKFVDRGVLGAGYLDEITETFTPIAGTVPQVGVQGAAQPVFDPSGKLLGYGNLPKDFKASKDFEPAAKTPKARTEMQAKAKVSASQAENAELKLKKLKIDPTYFLPGVMERFKSDARKQFEQSAEEFTEAALRFKTGASVTKEETKNALKIWIEQPGDDATTIANKKASRELLIREMREAGGGDTLPSSGVIEDLYNKYK